MCCRSSSVWLEQIQLCRQIRTQSSHMARLSETRAWDTENQTLESRVCLWTLIVRRRYDSHSKMKHFFWTKNQLKDSTSITELLHISAYNLHRPLVGSIIFTCSERSLVKETRPRRKGGVGFGRRVNEFLKCHKSWSPDSTGYCSYSEPCWIFEPRRINQAGDGTLGMICF